MRTNKWKYLCGTTEEVIAGIRVWEYGVLMLMRSEARGVDTRF